MTNGKELHDLRKGTSHEKPIEVLLQSDPKTLTDYELFRIINHYDPEIQSMDDLNDELLKKMAEGELNRFRCKKFGFFTKSLKTITIRKVNHFHSRENDT